VDAGLARAIRRNQQTGVSDSEGRFEEEALAFHSRIRDGYFHLAAMEPDRFRIVGGDQSPAATNRQILSELEPLLE
jgi:dTMP kinase